MACCISTVQCDSANGNAEVLVVVDPETNSAVYFNLDGSVWAGSPADLGQCFQDTDTFGTLVDNGDDTYTWTSADGATTFTIDSTDTDTDTFGTLVDNGDGTYTWTSADGATTFNISGGSSLNKVDADGVTSIFDPVNDCVPNGAFQRFIDYQGDTIDAAGCSGNPVDLHRSLGIGNGHIQVGPGAGSATHIGVSSLDSEITDTGITTQHHLAAVIASSTSQAGAGRSVVASSIDSTASGLESFIGGTQNVQVTGSEAAIIGSRDSVAGGNRSANIAAIRATTSAIQAANVATDTVTVTGNNSGNFATITSDATGQRTANIASEGSTAGNLDAANVASADSQATGAVSGNFATNAGTASGATSANVGSFTVTATNERSVNIGSLSSNATAPTTGNYSSSGCDATVGLSSNISSLNSQTIGARSVNLSSLDSVAGPGDSATNIAASGGLAVGNLSAVVGGLGGNTVDDQSVSLSGGIANAGQNQTFAQGAPGATGPFNVRGATHVGFRGAVPTPPRAVTTLADVILALQEQGLAI